MRKKILYVLELILLIFSIFKFEPSMTRFAKGLINTSSDLTRIGSLLVFLGLFYFADLLIKKAKGKQSKDVIIIILVLLIIAILSYWVMNIRVGLRGSNFML